MTPEISEEDVIVSGKVSYGVVFFGGCVDYGAWVMCEASKVGAILLRQESLHRFAFQCIIEKEGVGACGSEEKFSLVVKVDRSYMSS